MRVMMDLNTIGIDPAIWRTLWDMSENPHKYDYRHFLDSMSPHQLESKVWLVDELTKILFERDSLKIQLYGGWVGVAISALLHHRLDIEYIENVDIDPKAIAMFRKYMLFKGHKFWDRCHDVTRRGPRDHEIDLVINTSSEHMPNMKELVGFRKLKDERYRKDTLFAIQSNNMFHLEEHINCVNSADELFEKSGLHEKGILYSGEIEMRNGYKRFMVIGYAYNARDL